MAKSKWVLVCGVILLAFSVNAFSAGASDARVFLQEEDTTEFSATAALYVTSLTDGTRSAISVSNLLGVPSLDGVNFGGFPGGGNTTGAVWAFCFNTLESGAVWVYNSSDSPVGAGLDAEGLLAPGSTWIVFQDEFLATLGFDPAVDNFAGYCYFIGEFDAIGGTYVNTFESVASQQAFPMQSDFSGTAIQVEVP